LAYRDHFRTGKNRFSKNILFSAHVIRYNLGIHPEKIRLPAVKWIISLRLEAIQRMSTRSEIFEQPQVLANLLDSQMENVTEIAATLRSHAIQYAFLAARGTSDNAGRYANYLWGAFNHLPIALATPSLFTLYGQPPRLDGALVLGVSQSGQSPDIVRVLEEGRRQGRPTLAITNAIDSPLAQAADFVIDVCAGDEKAVAATKTYSAELMAIAMLSAAMHGDAQLFEQLRKVPDWVRLTLGLEDGRTLPLYATLRRHWARLQLRHCFRMVAEAEGAYLRGGRALLLCRFPSRPDCHGRPGFSGDGGRSSGTGFR
jgi:glucosamine 6-phosphate synthetase-like amidotransferase/phosphosugar isomerase protein